VRRRVGVYEGPFRLGVLDARPAHDTRLNEALEPGLRMRTGGWADAESETTLRDKHGWRRLVSHVSRVRAAGQVLLQGRLVANGRKVRVGLCLLRGETFLHFSSVSCGWLMTLSWRPHDTYRVVVPQQLIQEVDRFVADESLVLRVDEAVPGLLLEAAQDVVVLGVELDLVLVEVVEQVVGAKNLGNLDELVGVAVAMEEGLLAEDHGGKHGAETPHVQAVVVLLEVDEQLRALEVAGGDADVVLGTWVVELGQTPVDEAELRERLARQDSERKSDGTACLLVLMVDHNVVRLDVAMHDALAVAVVESLEQLEDVVADIDVVELGIEGAEVGVIDVFEDERGSLALRVPHDVEQSHNVGPAGQVLQDLDLALYLLLLDGLENLDDAFLVVDDIDAFEDLRVLSAACTKRESGQGDVIARWKGKETNRSS